MQLDLLILKKKQLVRIEGRLASLCVGGEGARGLEQVVSVLWSVCERTCESEADGGDGDIVVVYL